MKRTVSLLHSLLLLLVSSPLLAQSQGTLELRNLGLAQLENERPAEAEATFRRLLQMEAADPLPAANLAVALLRQQKADEARQLVDLALARAPGRGDLLAIKGEVLIWTGAAEEALAVLQQAAAATPNDPEIQYALYRHASTLRGEAAEAAAAATLRALADLRPENLVVLLKLGQLAIAEGDRTTASGAYLRIRELLWQAQPIAAAALEQVTAALEANDLDAARVPAIRLENVLKIEPMWKSSLVELYKNIVAVPVERFVAEPEPTSFGEPAVVRFDAAPIAEEPGRGRALLVADLDGDTRPDIARLVTATADGTPQLEIRLASGSWLRATWLEAPAVEELILVDLDNDFQLDLIGYGGGTAETRPPLVVWRNEGEGSFAEATASFGLAGIAATGVAPLDFDSEGDLDLAVALDGTPVADVYRNLLAGPLEPVAANALPPLRPREVHQLLAADLDRDGDTDLLLVHENGVTWLDNLRQGRFNNRTAIGGLRDATPARAATSADLDNDGEPDLVLAGDGLRLHRNLGGVYEPAQVQSPATGSLQSVVAFDADNDGRLDLAAAGSSGLVLLGQRQPFVFTSLAHDLDTTVSGAVAAVAAADLDGDGDLDLVTSGTGGLHRLDNVGGNRNHWLTVRLEGLTQGNDKNNVFGRGASLEVRVGRAYQYREVTEALTHFGLGRHERADSLRIVWANGVPQHRIHPEVDQRVVEKQVLKGSCPFLYTWDGEAVRFVTDLLWGSPIGMPVAPGVWAGADPEELVRVDGAAPRAGVYDLRITEELWEAAFFDLTRLWVVDHPAELEVASSLRIVPGEVIEDRVLATRGLRPVAAAWDGRGRQVTARVAKRDEVYADGFPVGDYQGVAPRPWSFVFDLGEAPAAAVRLHVDGWIFPADASLNLAVAQRSDLDLVAPRLEVETGDGWQPLLDPMGFFAGKTKTLVLDLPPLPPGARRLRITTSQWLAYDRIAWSTTPDDGSAVVQARLLPATAELRFRGFSRLVRAAPNAPHSFVYDDVATASPWLPLPGRYTRFGDVRELVVQSDDRSVILAAGDELALTFDASHLPPPAPGHRRTLFLESHGWDKDADRNTYEAQQLEPLPFRAMSGYPYGGEEAFPNTPLHRHYRRDWLTRSVPPEARPHPGTTLPSSP